MTSRGWLWRVGRGLRGSRRWILPALVALAVPLAVASLAHAGPQCTDSWKAAVDGSWSDGNNWSTGAPPGPGDTACITVAGSYTVTLTGAATVAGLDVGASSGTQTQTLRIAGDCNTNTALTAGAGNVTANGSLVLTELSANCINNATLNMTNGATLTNAGTLISDPGGGGGARQITGNLVNQGTVTIDQPTGIDNLDNQAAGTVAVNQSLSLTGQSLSNEGQVAIADATAINATANTPTLTNTGTITATGSGLIRASGATFNVGPNSSLTGSLPLVIDGSTLNQQGGTISAVRLRAGDNLNGDIPTGETLQIAGDCNTNATINATSLTNRGTVQLTELSANCINNATLNMTNGATLTNAGTLISDPGGGGGARQIDGIVQNGTQGAGAAAGLIQVSQPLNVQGNLANDDGSVAVAAGDQLTVNGNYTQSSTADFAPQIASAASFGAMDVTGNATIDGSVSLSAPSSAVPNQSFPVLIAEGLQGTFSSANAVVSPSDGTYYLPSYSRTKASLSLVTGSLSASPTSGRRDASITVSGAGWPASDTVTIGFADSSGTITRTSGIQTDPNGSFMTAIQVPDRAAGGAAQIWLESRFTGGLANRMTRQAFTVNVSAPAISGIQPGSGPAAGGTSVTVTGSDFAGATDVRFGQAPASRFSVDSNSQITATSPAGAGTVDVTVSTPAGTSAANSSDVFTYTSAPPPPSVMPGTVAATTSQKAALAGTVNPHGSTTLVHFEYGLDNRYRPPGATGIIYDQATSDQPIGSGSSDVPVSATASNLVPNALYHVRLVATNAAGTARGADQTFTTPPDPAPPAPRLGQSEDVKPAGGTVFVLKAGKLVPLTESRQLPSGSVLDTRHGTIALKAAGANRTSQTGTFTGAVFKLTQSRAGLTTLTLLEGAFPGAPTYASCRAGRASTAAHVALSSRILQTLRSRARGRFRTRGRYAAGTVRGTQWTTSDRCDGTLISVQVHRVLVTDFVKHVTVLVKAGRSYLARAGRR